MRTSVSRRQPMPGYPLIAALVLAILLALVLLFLPPLGHSQERGLRARIPPVRDGMLVSAEWLSRHLHDPNLVVLQVAREKSSYDGGHIPGARFLPLSDLAVSRGKLLNELPSAEDFQKVFERLGVDDTSRVILYGDRQGILAARAYFTLDYFGHGDHAALLDGGLEKWKSDNRPVSTEAPAFQPAKFTPRVRPEILIDMAQMRQLSQAAAAGKSPEVVLLDARPAEEWAGEKPSDGIPRQGHIPGAASLYWMRTVESAADPEILPPYELRKLFLAAGAEPGRRVVTYCQSGMQASHLYFTARYLGYEAAMYDGSFSEWSNAPDAPVDGAEKKP